MVYGLMLRSAVDLDHLRYVSHITSKKAISTIPCERSYSKDAALTDMAEMILQFSGGFTSYGSQISQPAE
jgi:hypothetical protein